MRLDRALDGAARPATAPDVAARLSFFEFWPGWLFYAPVVAWWVLLGLRYRDPSLPTAANPTFETGGLCGESKRQILDQAGPLARGSIAPYASMVTDPADPAADMAEAERAMAGAGIGYPVVVKPDVGCNGTGVRLAQGPEDLARYFGAFPRGLGVMLQAFVPHVGEAGLFYVRLPGEARGRITSVTLKHQPCVTGDGRSDLRSLILADARAGRVSHLYLPRLERVLATVPRAGERVPLVFAGNHCTGSIFEDGAGELTPALAERVDAIARDVPEFHFGRIDVRYRSLAALRRGEEFTIIEINGAGSEPTHIWDPRTRLLDAWRTEFWHYGAAFRIGAANRARGLRPCGLREMGRMWRFQRRVLAAYPQND